MLFAVCTPAIASEARIGLALRIFCGFGIDEIAEAFLTGVALNRTFALYKANGREQALTELEKLKLEGNHFYHVLRDYLKKLPPH
ncbi:MAG TPA: hypothetical protein VL978_08325 [Puia sp.]|nr:hypothetical protein [Puia sp.]